MSASRLDLSKHGSTTAKSIGTTLCTIEEVELLIEKLEGIIAPAVANALNEMLK